MKIKYSIVIALVFVMAMSLLGTSRVAAQALTYTSGVQVVNLENLTATIEITYYNSTGTVAGTTTATINPLSSITYYPLTGAPTGFNGSMVISSDRQIAAIANLVTTDNLFGASTTGFSQGANNFSLPLIMCNNSGFNTFFSVQNTGGSAAGITINYIPGSNGVARSETATIQPGAALSFDQTTGSSTVNCSTLADAGSGKFIGSATITSNQPVVATVMQLNTTNFRIMMGYNGFANGSQIINLPLIMSFNSGYYTGFQVQNVGTNPTVVTVEYAPNTVGTFNPSDDTCSLDPGESCTLLQNTGQWTGRYIGAATISNSANQDLVAIVNQVSPGGSGLGPFGTAYEGFNPDVATSNINAPLIMANNSGYYTGIQVQNVSGTPCTNVTIDYGPNVAAGGTFNPVNETFSLQPFSSKTIIQNSTPLYNGGANNWVNVGRYIGSAEMSATGCSIVAIVNEVAVGAGDKFFSYDGLNH